MQKIQKRTDKFAITVSLACAIHCLFVPSFVILSAGFLSITIDNEFIHKLLIFIVIPVSIFALYAGYKNHKTTSFFPAAIIGMIALVVAVIMGERLLGELGEQAITLLGSLLLVFAHYQNFQTCKKLECDDCHEKPA